MFFITYGFKGQVHVFVGRVKIVSHSSSRTSAILNYFCSLLSECQTVWIQIRIDILSVLIWVQTVCKGYQQMRKVATSKERLKPVLLLIKSVSYLGRGSGWGLMITD